MNRSLRDQKIADERRVVEDARVASSSAIFFTRVLVFVAPNTLHLFLKLIYLWYLCVMKPER